MIYNKKKDSFKKNRQQIFHKEANKTILNMIAQRIQGVSLQEVDSNILQPQQTVPKIVLSPNRQCTPSRNRLSSGSGKVETNSTVARQNGVKIRKLRMQHLLDIKVKNQGKADKIKQQYINLLQQQLASFKNSQKEQKQLGNSQYLNKIVHLQQKARALILQNCMQLIQCKVLLQGQNQTRVKSINLILGKNQQYIEVQAALLQRKDTSTNNHEERLQQLQEICKYQEKIIKHLRQQKGQQSPINQLQLLRHQINRVSIDNERLRQRIYSQNLEIKEFSAKKSIDSYSSIGYIPKEKKSIKNQQLFVNETSTQTIDALCSQVYEKQKRTNKFYGAQNNNQKQNIIKQENNTIYALQKQIEILKLQVQKEKEAAYKLTIEKQYLIDMVEQEAKSKQQIALQTEKIKKLTSHIEKIQSHNRKLQKQNKVLTMKQNSSISTTQDTNIDYRNLSVVIKSKLQQFPSAFQSIYPCLKQYLDRMNNLRQAIQHQTDKNESIIKWCRQIYQQLQNLKQKFYSLAQKDKSLKGQLVTLEKDISQIKMQEFFNLQLDNDRISELLRKIKALSIGIEDFEMKDMEQQLQQYVLTLKGRNQAIREVQNEDGSSVHTQSVAYEAFYEENQ